MASETSRDFNITTVGYYKRDNDMNVSVDAQPRCVNSNFKRLLNLQETSEDYTKECDMNLKNPEVKRDGNVENFFESLLNYISIKGFGEKKPLFVTYKQILADIATKPRMSFHIFCHMDMIFISYKRLERDIPGSDETEQKRNRRAKKAMEYTIDANFAHYWTKESEDEEIPEDYAKSKLMLLKKVEVLKFEDVSSKLEKIKKEKSDKRGVSNGAPFQKSALNYGKGRVRHFLSEVKKACNDSDDCFLATDTGRNWSFEKVDEEHDAVREFVNLVKTKMAVWKTNFPNECSN